MRGCVRALAAGLGLAAALAVFAAAPALAFWIKSPAFLVKDSLNGATVTVTTGVGASDYFSVASIGMLNFWTLSGIPDSVTVRVSAAADGGNDRFVNSPRDAILTLSFSGDFSEDWELGIYGDYSLFNLADSGQSFGTIPVRVSGGAGLRVGSVSGQATEAGGTATFPVRLWTQPSSAVTVSVSSLDTGEGTVSPQTLTFTGGSSGNWNVAQTVTVTGVDDSVGDGTVTWQVRLDPASGDTSYNGLANLDVNVTTTDDELRPNVGAVSGQATEAGGTATFTVALPSQPSAAVTVTVSSLDTGEGTVSPPTLIFNTSNWNTAQTVTVTGVNDNVDDGTVTWQVRLDHSSGGSNYTTGATDVDVTTADDDGAPGVTLALDPASVSENGGISTVTARLSRASGAATTVTVTTTAVSPAVAADFTQSGTTLTVAAGAITSTGLVTVTAVDNTTDAPDRTATVTATVTNARAVADSTTMTVTGATLTLEDDDAAPGVALSLDPASVAENGGVSTVTATLSGPSSEPSTVTVTAVPGSYTVAANATLTVAAGFTVTTDTTTVTAVDDDVHQGTAGRSVTVTGTLTNGQGAGAVSGGALTLTDDETLPTLSLELDPSSISENGGVSTVTAGLSGKSSEAVTVTVGAAAGTGATAADFNLSTAATLTIAAGATTSAGVVTVTAVDDTGTTGSIQVTVSGTAAGGNSVLAPANRTLTITDDDTPQATLALSSASISENGGVATVTATLDRTSSVAVTVTVAAAAGTNAVAGDFTLSTATTLTFAANATTSAGLVTVTAVNNTTDAPDKSVTVSGTASDNNNWTNDPPGVTLAITDDDAAPGVTLALDPSSIAEPSGVSTVTATLSRPSSEPSTVTVTAVSGAYTVGTDATITIAAGSTTAASDTVLITAVDDDLHHGNAGRSATVTAALTNGQGAGAVTGASLTITDDETLPTVGLVLSEPDAMSADAISENGGVSTVTATLTHPTTVALTVTVTAEAIATTGTVAGDFTQGGTTLTIAARATTSTGLVTVTGVDNDVDAADKRVRVIGATEPSTRARNPDDAMLTLTNDDDATATLVLNPAAILENGGISTVTATLSHPTTEAATLTVATTAVSPAVSGDFTRAGSSLTIAANATTSTGLVTITAVDNNVATGNKQVRVSASAAGGRGVSAPSVATLIIRDDEFGLSESAVSGQATEGGGTATFTVRLNTQPSAAVTVAVTSRDASEGTVSPPSLTFAPGAWNTAQTVTVTGVQDSIDDGTVTWQVRLDPSSGDANYNTGSVEVDMDVTTTDDDDPPTVTMALSPSSVAENGGLATVTARLSHGSGAATTLTVAAVPGSFTVGTDATIVIPAEATAAPTDTVLVTAVDNTTDEPDRTATVTATVTNARAAADSTTMTVTGASLTVRDDDAAPGVALAVNPASVAENGGVSTVTATLSRPSSQPSTVTVTAVSGSYAAGTDATIVIAAGSTTAASDTATVTAVDDDVHQGSAGRSVTVTAALANGQGAGAVTGAALTLTDDETLPTLSLALGPSSVSENGGVSTVTAALSGPSSQPVTVTVASAAVSSTGAVAGDFTQTGTTLTVAAGETTGAGLVTVRGNDNRVDAADKQVTVSGTAAGGNGVAAPSAATLTLTDDEATATASLVLTPRAILENEQVSTVTAVLSYPTTEAVTLTVSTAPVSPAVATDFTQSSTATLTIAAGETTSAGVVTVQAHDNTVASGRKFVTVSATAAGGRGVAAPADARLTIRDDEYGLDLGAVSGRATEGGGRATFTVALQTQPSSAVTVTVTSRDAGEGTVSPSSLVFTTGNWSTARTVTARGVDDSVDDGDVVWRVRLDPSSGDANYDSSAVEEEVDVTTEDDDGLPTMSLVLLPSSIGENGGVSTVEARLSHGSGEAATVAVSFAAVAPAAAGDFTESAALTLTIAAEATSSTGVVTAAANDNTVVSPDKRVTVSGAATGGYGVASPPPVTLTIENDDEGGLALPSGVVTPTAGGAAAVYTVALTRAPADAVTVSVTRDNSDVTVDPSSLTFTMGNWNVAQPVTVTAALDTDAFPDEATLAHAASGGGYDGVTGSVAVAVDDRRVTGIPLGGAAVAGTKTYRVNRQLVTVTWPEEARVREDVVEFELGDIDGPVTVTIAPLPEGRPARAGTRYSLGPAASRVALNIEVSPVPEGGVDRLCLRVPDGLREAARGRGLVLLRNGAPLPPPGSSDLGARVCAAGVSSFSPFAVGYEDTSPVFPEFTMTSMVFTVNQAVETDPLPLAVGGDGTRHVLSPARLVERLEAVGVEFDRARRVFSGTPTKAFAEEEFTWTATDVDGDEAEPLKFTIAVKAALEDARKRLTAVNKSVLPELSRAMWGSALDAVTGRLGGVGVPGAGGSAGLAGGLAAVDALLRANADKLEDGRASLRELVSGRRVALRLGASGSGGSGAGSQGAVVWMSGDWRKLSRKQAGLDWSGDLFAAHVGADAALGPRLRGGIAASRYASAVTYTDGSELARATAGAAVVGVHRTRMTTATPYIGVTGDRARAWAALGLGGGRVEIDDAEVVNQRLGEQSSGARFTAAALGGSARLSSGGSVEVRVKASGETSRFTVRGNGEEGAIAPLAATAQRLRLSAEGSRTWALSSGAELTPALEVGGRWDGGGGATGAGIEVGGGVVWSDPGAGLTMEARARALVAHRGGAREHGVSAAVRLEPGARGRGLSLSLSPSWGKAESGMERLWRTGAAAAEAKPRSAPRLEAELGYGVAALGGSATLTPYGGFGIGEDGERRWRLGGRLELGQTFGLRLEAGRRDSPTTRPDNSIKLTLDARW